MAKNDFRIERDGMGAVKVPKNALYGAQTQRALENFPVSGERFPRDFISALGLIKASAARVNRGLGRLDARRARAVERAAEEVAAGRWDAEFPLDIFQTGSGTSTNMNANEVIAALASRRARVKVHPNDHVNMGQSSNDVIPTAIAVSASLRVVYDLLPALRRLRKAVDAKAREVSGVVKTGRTHLMDALPVRMGQELSGWAEQIANGARRLEAALPRMKELALGGTAVGTGLNAPKGFGTKVARELSRRAGVRFRTAPNYFEKISTQDAAVELSGQLKTVAVSLLKISNDLRWMNSGPNAGLAEIVLPALQPGSSIMPGKVNPVIPEAAAMAAAQVIGNDLTITVAGQSGNFQLNVMLPVIARNLLESIGLLAAVSRLLADRAIAGLKPNRARLAGQAERNPILVTALNPIIGYELGAKIAKTAFTEGRKVKDVAAEMTRLGDSRLERLLDPRNLTTGGVKE